MFCLFPKCDNIYLQRIIFTWWTPLGKYYGLRLVWTLHSTVVCAQGPGAVWTGVMSPDMKTNICQVRADNVGVKVQFANNPWLRRSVLSIGASHLRNVQRYLGAVDTIVCPILGIKAVIPSHTSVSASNYLIAIKLLTTCWPERKYSITFDFFGLDNKDWRK